MVNTGAIAATSLVRGEDAAERLARILDFLRALSGRPVGIDEAVYLSERATGHRNRAIAYLELNNGMSRGMSRPISISISANARC
jgi:glutaminase